MAPAFKWYKIVDDGQPSRCSDCGKYGKLSDMIYLEVATTDPKTDKRSVRALLLHKKCITEGFLENHPQGEPPKKRTAARIWHTRKPVLRLVKK